MANDDTHSIEHRDDGGSGGFFIDDPNGTGPQPWLAELTYRWRPDAKPRVMIIDHTGVRDSLKGQGVARRLVETAIDTAREEGFKIHPVCSYAVHVFDKLGEDVEDIRAA